MNVSANKIELVAKNFVDQDLDLDSIKQLYKDAYIKGFKRGVERCDASVPREAWIDIDADHGVPYSCTARFSNLQTLLNTLDILIDEVTFVLPCENRYEYSMQRAGQEVRHWIKDKRQQFAYNLGEGEQDG